MRPAAGSRIHLADVRYQHRSFEERRQRTAGLVGSAIISNPWVRIIGGLVIIVFGLHLIGLLKIKYLYKDTRQFSSEKPRGMLGSLTLGIAFAAGWTPCIGPILGGIIGLAATSGGWKGGLLLSAFYYAGLSVQTTRVLSKTFRLLLTCNLLSLTVALCT